ncbi:hypothetical protein [Lysinibacillus boronitolerans]|uniref:hypothetical protein n=1 Tax=Lysinibacillus boronitolerans TaxID=309788 RepID=UPI00289F97E4|nr:hypothetical protein [Lysinibacillus boronitolerans]
MVKSRGSNHVLIREVGEQDVVLPLKHVRKKLINIEKVDHYLRMLQSSSPSYMIMASLDDASQYVATYLESD